ncbi:MAG TPA: anaerobic sulfatase maturase [Bacteroidales bacterium]|nr:anaerobic sulfatase maturase [Bacteroidales bacterium]
MNDFQIFVKPVGAECNLRCRYCYYLEKRNLWSDLAVMKDDVLVKYIITHFNACRDREVSFTWHGGEPLLAGIDFFSKVVSLQAKYCPLGMKVRNGIQTNGTLLNEEWCSFLVKHNFYVGISIDGSEVLHNRFRHYNDRRPSFNNVINGFRLLKESGITPEVLCVVNSVNVRHPLKVYGFFRDMGVQNITFLPLVERRPDLRSGVSPESVSSEAFGIFLSRIFDQWVQNGIGEVKIQIFEEATRTAFNQEHTLCIFRKKCGAVPVIEKNGDFYSCDHYVDAEHLVGNIKDNSIKSMLGSRKQIEFGAAKLNTLPGYCINCPVRDMCNGECPKNRFISTPDGEPGLNYLCQGYRYFFNHCKPFVDAVSQVFRSC